MNGSARGASKLDRSDPGTVPQDHLPGKLRARPRLSPAAGPFLGSLS